MDATLQLTHERVDDVPLLLGFLAKLQLPQLLDRHLPAHPLHQGLSNGWLITVWISLHPLSRASRPSQVPCSGLGRGAPSHPSKSLWDSRFEAHRVLRRPLDLGPSRGWPTRTQITRRLWKPISGRPTADVYGYLAASTRKSDSTPYTTSCGYHLHHHRRRTRCSWGTARTTAPTWPSSRLMAAVAEPTGLFSGRRHPHPGHTADDPLYLPLYRRVRATCSVESGLLSFGRPAGWRPWRNASRDRAAHQDFYLTRLPLDRNGPSPVRDLGRSCRRW